MSLRPSSLHVLCSFDNALGGSVHAALNVCKHLARDGFAVAAAASHTDADDVAYLETTYAEFEHLRFARSFPQRLCDSRALLHWLATQSTRFDVVELHGIFVLTTLRTARACRQLGLPYLVRPHGQLDPFDLRKHAKAKAVLGPACIRPLLQHSAGVVCTTELEAERLVTYGARPPRHVVPLPVPVPETAGDGLRFRERHGISRAAKVVLFLSRVDYKKGLEFLIPAIAKVRRDVDDVAFVLAGTGTADFVRSIEGLIARDGIADITRQVGFLSGTDKADAIAAADVFALPSLNENFGIVLVEAMQAGVALLASNEVYISREIAAAGAGEICEPSVPSVTASLRSMLADSAGLKEMGRRGRQLADSRFDPLAATRRLVELYRMTAPGAAGLATPGHLPDDPAPRLGGG